MSLTEIIINLIDNVSGNLDGIASNAESAFNQVGSSADQASAAMDSMGQYSDSVKESVSGFDISGIENLEDAATSAGLSVEQIGEAASAAGSGIGSIDSSPIKDAGEGAKEASEGLDEAAESANLLEVAFGGLAAIGIDTYLEGAAEAAGSRSDEWLRLAVNVGGSTEALNQVKGQYTEVIGTITDETGRGTGSILSMINQLSTADIEAVGVQTELASAITGTAFNLKDQGASIESVTQSTTKMVSSGNLNARMLKQLGITTADLTRATGMSEDQAKKYFETLDSDGRAAFLANIMNANGAAEGNEAYKQSWEHVSDSSGRAFDYLQRIVGELILPFVIPAVEKTTDILSGMAEGLSSLPGPVQTIIGVLILLVAGLVSAVSAIGILNTVTSALGIGQGIAAMKTAIWTTVVWGQVLASEALTIAQGALNAVMSANPIGIIIIAIVALIAALGYLYYHNETVRNAINWLWQGLQDLGGYIMGGLMAAWNALTMALQPVTDAVMTLWHWITGNSPGLMPALQELGALFFSVWQAISTTVLGVITAILDHIGRVLSIFTALIQGNISFTQAIQMLWNSMKVMLLQILGSIIAGIGGWVVNMSVKALQAGQAFATNLIMFLITLPVRVAVYLNYIIQRALNFAISLRARATQAGSNFLNGLISMISQAPGKVGQELLRIVQKIMSFGGELYNKARDLGNKIKDGLMQALGIASPGYMYYAIEGELGRIEDVMLAKQSTLGSAAGAIGGSITDGFGNPSVNPPTGIGAASTSTPQIDTAVLAASSEQTKNILQGTSNFAATTMTDMNTTMKTGFTTMADDNTNAFQTITTTTRNSLASVRSTTLKEVNNVRSSWQGMQSALVGSASTIKNQVTGSISTLTRNMATFWNRIQNPRLLVAGGYAGPGPSHSAGRYAGGLDPYNDKNLMNLFECNDPWGCYAGGWNYNTPWTSAINSSMGGWKPKFGSLGNLGLSVSSFKNSTWPVDGNLALFTALAEKLIGPTAYDFYYNGRYTNAEALARGAFNCWDGAEILVSLAQALGLDASMVHGHWGSIGHMAARVNGVIFDTTQRQNRGVWRGTPGVNFAGPTPGGSGSDEPVEVILKHIVDLQNVPEGNNDEAIGEIVLQGMEDRRVLDAFAKGAGREVNRQRRIHGV